ncbi:replication restart helicase PriA [Candidatus Erwinia haradaeae]|uniref:Replication restart protein PriA n=1 Tax=Candidatus Erwinia haradaeae TaxID=1922217 RepID=A0A451D8X8_9GAMM|nr:primosomal protein N' [Candidatus Erwinia haradaeae]VFP82282.1 Primosomal protein N' [Candidatus Erwinia haradaeae]
MPVVQVVLPIPYSNSFDYILPIHIKDIIIGGRVRVPFGNRQEIGITISIKDNTTLPYKKLKKINAVLDTQSLYHPTLWLVLHWIAEYYHLSLGMILFHALPSLLCKGALVENKPLYQWVITSKGRQKVSDGFHTHTKRDKLLTILYHRPLFSYQTNKNQITKFILQSLASKDLCKLEKITYLEEDWRKTYSINNVYLRMNVEQEIAVSSICKSNHTFIAWLLIWTMHDDKTEIYLRIIEQTLAQGKQTLILVPKISSVLLMNKLCEERFKAPIDILHSALNHKKHLSVWKKSRSGDIAIIIGTQSALFTPLSQLGLIIIDDEHHPSYQDKKDWYHNTRDIAVLRAQKENIPIIMGSATPALKTLHNVHLGKYHAISLKKSQNCTHSVTRTLIDLKIPYLKNGLSKFLVERISFHLNNHNQILFFLNHPDFSLSLLCNKCNWIMKCEKCNCYYTLHKKIYQLRCHYCTKTIDTPKKCFHCSSTFLTPINISQEQIKLNLQTLFPHFPVISIDSDGITPTRKSLDQVTINHGGKAHILIGTKELFQECFLSNVTLIALPEIDSVLFSTDFQALEHFSQFYHQVINILQNNKKKGEIIFQTRYPEHPSLQALLNKEYIFFAKKTLVERKKFLLPPYTKQIYFEVEDKDTQHAKSFLIKLINLIQFNPICNASLHIIGPAPVLSVNQNNVYTWQLSLYHPSQFILYQLTKISLISIKNLSIIRKIKWRLEIH